MYDTLAILQKFSVLLAQFAQKQKKYMQDSFEFLQYLGQCITLSISRAQAQLMFVKWNCKHDAYTIYDASFSIKRNRDQRHCFAVDSRQDWGVPQQWRRQQCQSFLFCFCANVKSDNLQYNMLGRWVDGTNDSATKHQQGTPAVDNI